MYQIDTPKELTVSELRARIINDIESTQDSFVLCTLAKVLYNVEVKEVYRPGEYDLVLLKTKEAKREESDNCSTVCNHGDIDSGCGRKGTGCMCNNSIKD